MNIEKNDYVKAGPYVEFVEEVIEEDGTTYIRPYNSLTLYPESVVRKLDKEKIGPVSYTMDSKEIIVRDKENRVINRWMR